MTTQQHSRILMAPPVGQHHLDRTGSFHFCPLSFDLSRANTHTITNRMGITSALRNVYFETICFTPVSLFGANHHLFGFGSRIKGTKSNLSRCGRVPELVFCMTIWEGHHMRETFRDHQPRLNHTKAPAMSKRWRSMTPDRIMLETRAIDAEMAQKPRHVISLASRSGALQHQTSAGIGIERGATPASIHEWPLMFQGDLVNFLVTHSLRLAERREILGIPLSGSEGALLRYASASLEPAPAATPERTHSMGQCSARQQLTGRVVDAFCAAGEHSGERVNSIRLEVRHYA